ncbi:MAG: hypothetical protein AAF492_24585, partial [Verrucomicrobiota bacterium]
LGVESIYRNRSEAYESFIEYLKLDEGERLWVIASSLQGFEAVSGNFSIWDAIKVGARNKNLRVLLTDPEYSRYREKPEERISGQIKGEIGVALNKLTEIHQVPDDFIRLYPGTPTVAAIATSSHMLLNPYPYGDSSFHCFSIIVRKTADEKHVYNQYIDKHFQQGWKLARELTDRDKQWYQALSQSDV